jgi:stage V sporulation protein B
MFEEIGVADVKKQNFMKGAAILAAGVALVKIMGAVFKISLANILSDEGVANFYIAHNIYSFLLILSTAGLPVALSRLIASANALGRPAQIKRTFRVAWLAFFVLGMASTLIMLLSRAGLRSFWATRTRSRA